MLMTLYTFAQSQDVFIHTIQKTNPLLVFGGFFLLGLALNLTPCVYPVIPITLAFFSSQSQEKQTYKVLLAFFYMFGIILIYGVAGAFAAEFGITFGFIFSKPWFLISLGTALFFLALTTLDLFTLQIPKWISRKGVARQGLAGAFSMGVLASILATPCSGPAMVAIFATAAKIEKPFLSFIGLLIVGLGFGLPYFALALFSSKIPSLPKSGNWLKLVKLILAFLVFGISIEYFLLAFPNSWLAMHPHQTWPLLLILSALSISLFETQITSRGLMFFKGLIIIVLAFIAGSLWEKPNLPQTIPTYSSTKIIQKVNWIPFNMKTFEEAKRSKKPIFIDVTANWCKKCKSIESNILDTPESIEALNKVTALKVDWSTDVPDEYINLTQKILKIQGPPSFLFLKPSGKEVARTENLKSPQMLIHYLNQAGGL